PVLAARVEADRPSLRLQNLRHRSPTSSRVLVVVSRIASARTSVNRTIDSVSATPIEKPGYGLGVAAIGSPMRAVSIPVARMMPASEAPLAPAGGACSFPSRASHARIKLRTSQLSGDV